jgi:hypothetical protein
MYFHDRDQREKLLEKEQSLEAEVKRTRQLQQMVARMEQAHLHQSSTSSATNSSTIRSGVRIPLRRSPTSSTNSSSSSPTSSTVQQQRPFVATTLGSKSKHYGGEFFPFPFSASL